MGQWPYRMSVRDQIWQARFEISDLSYLHIHANMVPYDGLRGHYSIQTASEAKSDLRLKLVTIITYETKVI